MSAPRAAAPVPAYAFAGASFDRGVDLREQHERLCALAADAGSRWLLLRDDGAAPVAEGQALDWREGCEAHAGRDWVFLGQQDGRALFAALADDVAIDADGWLDLRSAAAALDAGQAGLLAFARALCVWRSLHRHCGRCGTVNRSEAGGHRLRCPACGNTSFPRTDPAVIFLIRDRDRCLLGRQAAWPPGRYSTLAGFVEPGETLEAAVVREAHEEAGVVVDDCRYLGSQPWPFPASLMLGFEAHAIETSIRVGEELEDARWFDRDQLLAAIKSGDVRLPPRLSISRWLIERWLAEHVDTRVESSLDSGV
ncbi:NAD(+) diphosphatase [Pseudofulvimonas gallinarii]|uniref:NAD(+) diphosphatase n=1 Tax=Pseudofulvimonas gallinarii TaxID=634155 RepID=A0A4R3LI65_9GAMM|nr:NAD(+) diphosphatase [Pseudofulvimonas gallinarii]TCS99215.1 NAD+ diphosphatase [Pseudofulvimonas gallinarii]THD13981.1 hypothetical protein B1808_05695 [Pseudofulvimonas gallinarii]